MTSINTFVIAGFDVEALANGAVGTVVSEVSATVRRWRFLGRWGFLPSTFDKRFLLAGTVFDGSESASCKTIK
jgi:hypothetical protein